MDHFSIFVSIIVGFATLTENMMLIELVPAGQEYFILLIMLLKDVYCIRLAVYSWTEFAFV